MNTYKPQNDIQITINLSDLLLLILGDTLDKYPIPSHLAHLLESHLSTNPDYIIIWESDKEAFLWRRIDWNNSVAKYEKQKAYSEKLRIEGWIKNRNTEMLIESIIRTQGLDRTYASSLANKLLSKNAPLEVLQMMGLEKLITNVEEL